MKRNGFQPKIMGFSVPGAACPSGFITMYHFTDEQILAQVEALFS
jgi:heterodisulfide reductase subunit A-like polyferredoxin